MSIASAKMPVACPQCSKQLMVPVSAAGKQGRCPTCSNVFVLPSLVAAEEVEDDLRLEPLASDPFGASVPVSSHQLQPASPQAYAVPAANYGVAAAPQQAYPYQQPVNPYMANAYAEAQPPQNSDKYNHGFGLEQRGWDAGMLGGLGMMAISVLIFGVAWALGYFVPYALLLFIVGLVGFFRGLFTGNIAGGSN